MLLRSLAWKLTIDQALEPPQPSFTQVFSAFSVGMLGNAVLPGRIGELARVAVLRRHLPRGRGASGALVGTVFAHRLFDVPAALLLILYVAMTAKVPHWAITSLVIVSIMGVVLFTVAFVTARRHHRPLDGARSLRQLLSMARQGLAVMRSPWPALGAILLQCAGWLMQLFAVYVSMRAFDIHASMAAAGLVLLLMNVATIFPLWPGNIGLLQAAVALPLVQYGVPYSVGFAYALVLQVIEMSVGVGVGLIFLAREGLSFANLRDMPEESEAPAATRRERPIPPRGAVRALACPASLKGVLTAAAAAAALAEGLRAAGADAVELPVADGGEGTAEALWLARGGEWREADVHDAFGAAASGALARLLPDGTAVVESAAAVPLDASRLDPLAASSRGFGELVEAALAAGATGLGARARRHRHHGRRLGIPRGRPRAAGARSRRLRRDRDAGRGTAPLRAAEGSRSGGDRGARTAVRGRHGTRLGAARAPLRGGGRARGRARVARSRARLGSGLRARCGRIRRAAFDLVVTGEGRVDATTVLGKAPGEIVRRAGAARCVVFGGIVEQDVPGAETVALSGDPARAREDLIALGRELG